MYPGGTDWIDSFYSADNLDTRDKVYSYNNSNISSGSISEVYTNRFGYLRNGTWISGSGDSWILDPAVTDWERLVYPDTTLPVSNELGGSQVAWTTEATLKGKSPVPNRVA
jgi:hypothetical protein